MPRPAPSTRDLVATYPIDVNFTPDFPSAAERFLAMYTARTGRSASGVISLDPRVVSRLLVARDPIPLPDGTSLDYNNVVAFLLSDVYAKFPTWDQSPARDAYTAAATSAAFRAVISGGGDLRVTVSNVKDMVDERRIMVWSAHPGEESALLATPVSGRLPMDPPARPSVGVFVNDGSGSKLGYYLDGVTRLTPGTCQSDGSRQLALQVDLGSSAPSKGLPEYVLGATVNRIPYQLQLNAMVFAPTGGSVSGVRVDGKDVPVLDRY